MTYSCERNALRIATKSADCNVALSWGWNYVTFQRGTRLITGISGARMEEMQLPQSRVPSMRGAA